MEICGVGLAKIGCKLMMNLENSFTGEKMKRKKNPVKAGTLILTVKLVC